MLKVKKILEAAIGGRETFFYEFENQETVSKVKGYFKIKNSLIILLNEEEIKSPTDFEKAALELRSLLDDFNFLKVRWSFQQFNHQDDYPAMLWYHLLIFSNKNFSLCAHLNQFAPALLETAIFSEKQTTMGIFSKVLNNEGWLVYCDWFKEDLGKIDFLLGMLDIYQVEAKASDFYHEISSPLLLGLRSQISFLTQQTQQLVFYKGQEGDLSANEKSLFDLRINLQANLRCICETLINLKLHIEKVETSHPELVDLKNQAIILSGLIEEELEIYFPFKMSWLRRQLLLSLMDHYLNITCLLYSSQGESRLVIVLAIKLAVIQCMQGGYRNILPKLAIQWDRIALKVNQAFIKGNDSFDAWVKGPQSSTEEKMLHKLRMIVFKNIQTFSWPALVSSFPNLTLDEMTAHFPKFYLNILPEAFVSYDTSSYEPLGLTPLGCQYLAKIKK